MLWMSDLKLSLCITLSSYEFSVYQVTSWLIVIILKLKLISTTLLSKSDMQGQQFSRWGQHSMCGFNKTLNKFTSE